MSERGFVRTSGLPQVPTWNRPGRRHNNREAHLSGQNTGSAWFRDSMMKPAHGVFQEVDGKVRYRYFFRIMELKRRVLLSKRPPIEQVALLVTSARHVETELLACATCEAKVTWPPDSTPENAGNAVVGPQMLLLKRSAAMVRKFLKVVPRKQRVKEING